MRRAEDAGSRRYPAIRFRASEVANLKVGADGELDGVLRGELALHGATRPLEVRFRARPAGGGYRATGSARFVQSDFGMKPYSTALGTIGVDDDVAVDFDLVLVPAQAQALVRKGEGAPGRSP